MEKIRFDRIKEKVLKIEKLQDKSSRYYFKDNYATPKLLDNFFQI